MPDMTMIEKVARAICAAYNGREPADIYVDHHWRNYIPEARAAIEAMREPTPGMVKAGIDAYSTSVHIWQAMIDAALKETP